MSDNSKGQKKIHYGKFTKGWYQICRDWVVNAVKTIKSNDTNSRGKVGYRSEILLIHSLSPGLSFFSNCNQLFVVFSGKDLSNYKHADMDAIFGIKKRKVAKVS